MNKRIRKPKQLHVDRYEKPVATFGFYKTINLSWPVLEVSSALTGTPMMNIPSGDLKKLHNWLGQAIAYLEQDKKK